MHDDMDSGTDAADLDIKTAQMTLLVLQASLRGPGLATYRLAPNAKQQSRERILRQMAQLSKPQECYATNVDSTLIVHCADVISASSIARYERQLDNLNSGNGTFGTILRELRAHPEQRMRLTGRNEVLRCTAAELERWQRDYVIHSSSSITVYAEGDGDSPLDIAFDVQIHPSRAVSFSNERLIVDD